MAYYYKLEDCLNSSPCSKDLFKFTFPEADASDEGPCIKYNFSKYVLIEFLDDVTPAKELWDQLGLLKNKEIIHKRLMWDPHRLKCRRAVVICKSSEVALHIATNIRGRKIKNRQLCAVVIEELISDICLFEKQIRKYGDLRTQEKLVYVSNLSRTRGQSALVQFLREKFAPFGSVLSILVSTDDDGLALGEAVIRFAYFSEAFASELALDEFVVGKERLHVTMQHNVLLSQCDLRVRLRDGLKEYHDKTIIHSAAKRFKREKHKAVESHGGSGSHESSYCGIEFPPLDDELLTHCEFLSPTQDIHKSIDMHMEEIMENVEQTPMEDSSIIQPCSNKRSYSECVLETTLEDTFSESPEKNILQIDRTESPLAISEVINSSSSDQSVSSKIFGWVKSLVWKSNTESSTQMKQGSKSSGSDTVSGLLDSSEQSNCGWSKSKDSPSFTIFKDKAENTIEITSNKQLNCKSSHNETFLDENQENLSTVQSKLCNYQPEVCSSSINKKDMKLNTSSVRRQADYHRQSTRKPTTLRSITPRGNHGTLVHLEKIIERSTDEICPQTTSNLFNEDELPQPKNQQLSQKRPLWSQNSNPSPSSVCFEQNDEVKKSSGKPTFFDTGQTAFSPHSQQSELLKASRKTTVSVKLKNKISSLESASLPLEISGCSHVATENTSQSKAEPLNARTVHNANIATGSNPIKDWLKKHLNETTNNRMTATKEKPEGIIFATMSKDILVTVGCSHMTCDACYPSGSDLIFGL